MSTKKILPSDLKLVNKTIEFISNEATGLLFRTARNQEKVSLREAARRMNVSAAFLSDLELGRRVWTEKRAKIYSNALFKSQGP